MARVTISSNNLFPGPRGAQGPAGPSGGPAGPTGPTGPQGNAGSAGAQGIQGPTGPTGAGGAQGLKGDTGNKGPTGDTGAAGTNGTNGTNGAGVVVGGTVGQALTKINSTDYNTQWTTIPLLTTANTFTGGVQQITTASAATKGLILKATASQTANLQEWQNSAGTVLASVSSSGSVGINQSTPAQRLDVVGAARFTGGAYAANQSVTNIEFVTGAFSAGFTHRIVSNVDSFGSARLSFQTSSDAAGASTEIFSLGADGVLAQPSATSTKALIVRGLASQTADLQQWQNSAGTGLVRVLSSGLIGSTQGYSNVANTGSYLDTTTNQLTVIQRIANVVGFAIKGAASQTANLQEWQNSAGTVLAKVAASGNIVAGNMAIATSSVSTVHISNGTIPSANPTGGGVLYVESGALKYRGSSGTVTTLGAA